MSPEAVTLLVIDVQRGTFEAPPPQHDAEAVIDRINALARVLRRAGGNVVLVQHDGPLGDTFEPGSEGWELVPSLERGPDDPVVSKRACDAFYETNLGPLLETLGTKELFIAGSATDFCVDTTVRAAASRDYQVTVVSDAHTTRDREHLDAVSIKAHHNAIWRDLILPRARVLVVPCRKLVEPLQSRGLTAVP